MPADGIDVIFALAFAAALCTAVDGQPPFGYGGQAASPSKGALILGGVAAGAVFLCLPFCLLWYRQGLLYDRRYGPARRALEARRRRERDALRRMLQRSDNGLVEEDKAPRKPPADVRLVINPDQSMACAERLSIGTVDIARASLSSLLGADPDLDVIGQKGDDPVAANLEAGSAQATAPVVTEAKSRWLASRLSRMVHLKPAARSTVEPETHPETAISAAGPDAATETGADAVRRSVELPAVRHLSDGVLTATHPQRTPFQEAVVQGATRSERIDALTEHPADGAHGSEAAQPVALISAVQTEDGRLVVDSIAAGDSDQSRQEVGARAAASLTAATTSGSAAARQQAGGHADDGLGSSTADGAESGPASIQASGDVASPRRRGVLQRLRLRPQPDAVDPDVLPADVP